MSDYPPAPPYGASYGSQPQTNPSSYLPPYQNHYMQQDDGRAAQTHMASNYDTSMSAYGYNNSIPGFTASSLASAAPPLPIYQGWNQDAVPLPSYSTPQNNMQYTGYGNNSYPPQHSYSAPQQPQTYHQHAQHVPPYDEGELSEGEFDTYGAQNAGGAPAGYGSNYYTGNDGTGYMNTAHRAVYPSGQDYNNQQYPSGNENNNYHRESASYSPYAPPPQDAQEKQTYTTPAAVQPVNGTPLWTQNHNAHESSHTPAESQPLKQVEQLGKQGPPLRGNPEEPVAALVQPPPVLEASNSLTRDEQSSGVRSVAEARKKAEGAILNLWPSDIRFPTYIEEGLDESIVGRLFDSLGLSRAASKTAISMAGEHSTTEKANALNPAVIMPESKFGDEAKREVLLENSGNGVAPSIVPPTQNKSINPTDKEKNLKMKMEMLRKSREERAQKAAAKTTTTVTIASPSIVPATAPQPEPLKPSTSTAIPVTDPLISSPVPPIQNSTSLPAVSSSSTSQPVLPPQPPAIPGLFLAKTSSPAPLTSTQNAMFGVPPNNQRKRPVAADFDAPASAMPFKRPFGESRNDSLVIDVSEEEPDSEDEDVAMDLESQADQDSPVQSARMMSDQRTAALQNLPPLTNFPTRKAFTSPPTSSAVSTPPAHAMAKTTLGHPQVLQQKETEIELLKKKIAEAMAAKEAKKKAQQTSSGVATPQYQPMNGASGLGYTNGDIASKVEASIQMQQLIGIAEDKVTLDQKRLAETQTAELEKAAEVKRNEAESRRIRREKIATDLPRVDAEVESSQLKLQQLRDEMARIEATVQKSLEDKRRMAEEMERLGQEAEEQLQEQKDKLKNLTTDRTSGSPRPTFTEDEQLALPSRPMSASSARPALLTHPGQEEPLLPVDSTTSTNGVPRSASVVGDVITSDQAMEAALQETIRADADAHSHEEGEVEMDIDMEDSYAPDPAQLAPESPHNVITPEVSTIQAMENDDDDYEPPEATPLVDIPDSPPFSPAPPESVHDLEEFTYGTPASGHENLWVEKNGPGKLQVNGSVPNLIEGETETSDQIQFFIPYESPLKYFRAFRFHPKFKQEVLGGLKSVTYSHKIDPNKEFCRYELAGGVCNDTTCEFQHFKDIALLGASVEASNTWALFEDTILSTLGSPEEFPADQQPKFREGLRQVLTGLRARKVRDFDTIAAEVVAHRSTFLGDPSKVLMLEGTTI